MTEGNEAHVHHFIVYLCSSVNENHVGNGGECDTAVGSDVVIMCRSGKAIAVWTIGGEVSSLFTFTASTRLDCRHSLLPLPQPAILVCLLLPISFLCILTTWHFLLEVEKLLSMS